MKGIQEAVNRLSPAAEFLNSRKYYLIRQIRQATLVSYIYPLRISIDNRLQERIEFHRLQIEVPVFDHNMDSENSIANDENPSVEELPALID